VIVLVAARAGAYAVVSDEMAMTGTTGTRRSTMRTLTNEPTIDEAVIRQASEAVGAALRGALLAALEGATRCGCRRCRAAAVRTFVWADALMEAEPRERER
jgi:pimeloyl-CoA synthetase